MSRKRGYASEESQLLGEDATQPPAVRSRRERAVKARLRAEDEGPSSSPDSGSGDHFDPVNVTEEPRCRDSPVGSLEGLAELSGINTCLMNVNAKLVIC